jgi:hypothetical protein
MGEILTKISDGLFRVMEGMEIVFVAYASDSKNQGDKDWVTAVTKCPLKLVLY